MEKTSKQNQSHFNPQTIIMEQKRESGIYRVQAANGEFDLLRWVSFEDGGIWRAFGMESVFHDSDFYKIHEKVDPSQPQTTIDIAKVIAEFSEIQYDCEKPAFNQGIDACISILRSQPSINVSELIDGLREAAQDLNSIALYLAPHPDCVEHSECYDRYESAYERVDKIRNLLKQIEQ